MRDSGLRVLAIWGRSDEIDAAPEIIRPFPTRTVMTTKLLSVNVGKPKNVAWQGETVFTGVWKHPVDGPVMARRTNLDGDGQGDLNGHGGEMRAVLVYQ